MSAIEEVRLRAELASLTARYDCGAVSSAVFRIIKGIQTEPTWAEHKKMAAVSGGQRIDAYARDTRTRGAPQ